LIAGIEKGQKDVISSRDDILKTLNLSRGNRVENLIDLAKARNRSELIYLRLKPKAIGTIKMNSNLKMGQSQFIPAG